MTTRSLWICVALVVASVACESPRRADDAQRLELDDRCQQMGARFAREIREGDQRTGTLSENREFVSRSHYNRAEKKCLVLTDGAMTMPLGIGRVQLTQVWDVALGVGGPIVAERSVPFTGQQGIKYFKGRDEVPPTPATTKWFDELMTK
jgi:hypothetical protein